MPITPKHAIFIGLGIGVLVFFIFWVPFPPETDSIMHEEHVFIQEISGFDNGNVYLRVKNAGDLPAYITDVLLLHPYVNSIGLWKEDYGGVPIEVKSVDKEIPVGGALIRLTVTFTPENLESNHEYRVILVSQRTGYFSPKFKVHYSFLLN